MGTSPKLNAVRRRLLMGLSSLAAMPSLGFGKPATATPGPNTLWYRQPASIWEEALPLGNGRLGAMVFGGLAALDEPLHGYAIMQKVEAMSEGDVIIGPGTLYGAFASLEKQLLITKVSEQDRRKTYALTEIGRIALKEQVRRLELMTRNGKFTLDKLTAGAAA